MSPCFDVVVEKDEGGWYVASVPEIPACHTQARTLDELQERAREAIELCLEEQGPPAGDLQFVGLQRAKIPARAGFALFEPESASSPPTVVPAARTT
jgi:predicted RNase H-like HicB family nuclease